MKIFRYNVQEDKDVIIHVPDELEVKREEVFALAALEAQDQIANGNIRVTQRIWPCLYCGTDYDEQGALLQHLPSHEAREKRLKEQLAHLYKNPEDIPPAKTAPVPQPALVSNQQVNYEKTDGYRVRQTRTALGESQAQFAKRFHITQAIVSRWETNRQKPPQEILQTENPSK
jgi:DNA-binding transcriptional regulator YiaG